MGKQICFYATQQDINAIVEQIYIQNGVVTDLMGKALSEDELYSIADFEYYQKNYGCNKFFVTKPDLSLCYHSNTTHCIDEMKAETLEFSLCSPFPEKIIDTSSVDNNFKKGGFVVIDDSDEYKRQMDELMKNPTYIDNPNYTKNGFEHGRLWYSSDYYDDNGNKVHKSKEIDNLFNSLSKFIKKNFKETKDKFAYIGPDAYKKYQEGVFIPCSGRNKIVVD